VGQKQRLQTGVALIKTRTRMQYLGKVGFIGHPQDMDMFRGYIRHLKPTKVYRDGLLLKLFEWTPSYKITNWSGLTFDGSRCMDAVFVMVPFLPEMRGAKLRRIIDKIGDALDICVQEGCAIAALGAFTSILMQGQEADVASKYRIRVTSGNSFTAALIIESIEALARRFGIALSQSKLAIIGASGDIGSACAGWFANKVGELCLAARGLAPLEDLAHRLESRGATRVTVTLNHDEALRDSRFVVFVTSAPGQLVSLDAFEPGAVVCDASAPVNVRTGGVLRPDVFVYHGGIARLPFDLGLGFDIGLASSSTFYGCQVEALLITADASLPHSWGRGNISVDAIQRYRQVLATYQGLAVSYSQGRHDFTEAELDAYAGRFARTAARGTA
jgi:fatty aldehyde-generating acyl-ACP reductase